MSVYCFIVKAVHSFIPDVSTSFNESRVGPDGFGGKCIPIASIRKYVDVLLVRLILQT